MAKDRGYSLSQRSLITLSRTFVAFAIVVLLYWGRPVLLPIAMATLLTFVLNPVVYGFQRLGIGTVTSVLLSVSIVASALTGMGAIGSRQVAMLLDELPENTSRVVAKVKSLRAITESPMTRRFGTIFDEIGKELNLSPVPTDSPTLIIAPSIGLTAPAVPVVVNSEPLPWMMLTGYLGSAVEVMATMAFTFVLLMCFLLERESLRDRLLMLSGRAHLTLTSKALEDATWRVSRYILMVAAVNGGFGAALGIGAFIIGVPYAILWGCMAAILRFIPYLGPWMGALFPIAMSVATADGWGQPITVAIYLGILELITNNLVEPIVFGRTIGVSPTALLVSAAFWLFLWGPIGLILSAPFAVVLVVLGKNIPALRFLDLLLGDQAALSADVGLYQRLLVHNPSDARLLIRNQIAVSTSHHACDDLFIPALNYAKRDHARGLITEEDRDGIIEALELAAVEHLTTDLSGASGGKKSTMVVNSPGSPGPPAREGKLVLLGCAADGRIDQAALLMLCESLKAGNWELRIVAEETLTSEVAAQVAATPPAAVCIVSLPPKGLAQARYLCKRLRAASPNLPLLVGRWGLRSLRQTDRELLKVAGANGVTLSIAKTLQWLDSMQPVVDHQQLNQKLTASLDEQQTSVLVK